MENARKPMSEPLVVKFERDNDLCILRISGRLTTGENEEYLQSKARELKCIGCRNLLVDVRGLRSTGSSGIGFIVDLYTSVTRSGVGRMVLLGPAPRVQEVLDITRLSTIIPIAVDLAAAIAFLTSGTKSLAGGS
jgi:anti-anti-sigma factor